MRKRGFDQSPVEKRISGDRHGQFGELLEMARRKCPDLVLVPSNYSLYEQCSGAFAGILWEYSDVVEQYSIDECFVDMTATCSGRLRGRRCS